MAGLGSCFPGSQRLDPSTALRTGSRGTKTAAEASESRNLLCGFELRRFGRKLKDWCNGLPDCEINHISSTVYQFQYDNLFLCSRLTVFCILRAHFEFM